MNMFNKLPYSIEIKGKVYKINTDFRTMILFENKMRDIKLVSKDEQNKIILETLLNFCPDFFKENNYNEIELKYCIDKLLWFYSCGRENYHKTNGKGTSKDNIYSYEYDDEYIFGAFFEQYKIDLTKTKLHWWKFKALLLSLKDDTQFEKIKMYRSYKGNDKDLKNMKKYWTLPNSKEEQRITNEITEELKKFKKKDGD